MLYLEGSNFEYDATVFWFAVRCEPVVDFLPKRCLGLGSLERWAMAFVASLVDILLSSFADEGLFIGFIKIPPIY
ncbi:hypothetical protein D3C74_391350 [compost metagenome]